MARRTGSIPGFRLQERRGAKYLTDIDKAIELSMLPQAEFLNACSLSFSKLVETFATARGVSKAQAQQEIQRRLNDLIREKKSSFSLVADRKSSQ